MKEIKLVENKLDIDTYLYLRESVRWKKLTREQAKKAIDNSLFTVCAYIGDKPIAMGRIVGDGAVICYVQDLIRHPDEKGNGIGRIIMKRLISFVKDIQSDNTEIMLGLMCAKGREKFYESLDFMARPTENLGPGMIMYLDNRE